jgi:hypothetical protein
VLPVVLNFRLGGKIWKDLRLSSFMSAVLSNGRMSRPGGPLIMFAIVQIINLDALYSNI